ncbi:MAG: AAA family ATPase [Ramlibacter sp.]
MPPARPLALVLAERLGAELRETHISWILLTREHAYKLKKPLRLPFLDYSTPALRAHWCAEEVRLNQRLAPALYLGVVRITGTPDAPCVEGEGDILDHAVHMRRFPDGALFSERLAAGTLAADAVDRLADRLARFHAQAPACTEAPAAHLEQRAAAALAGAASLLASGERQALQEWIALQGAEVLPLWSQRRARGRARDGHGDLHLANLLELDGEPTAFDCIEFDADLRRIDVIEDAAFTLMDFAARGAAPLGWRFFNRWLEGTGDYEGLAGLRLCLVYRALVRASAEHLRKPLSAAATHYAREALAWSAPGHPRLAITHGLPGSGKTRASQRWLEREGALRIRSDVERKRLHGLPALANSRAAGVAIYTREATAATYARLFELARIALGAGFPVVLDAAFLRAEERAAARALAREARVPFGILHCEAALGELRRRLARRQGDASEADGAVLDQLAAGTAPLSEAERLEVLPLP